MTLNYKDTPIYKKYPSKSEGVLKQKSSSLSMMWTEKISLSVTDKGTY